MNEYVVYHIDRPTEVKIGIYVISFYSINEQTMVSNNNNNNSNNNTNVNVYGAVLMADSLREFTRFI